jgi:RNA polymerase sigma-70 factor, ECF subfamily
MDANAIWAKTHARLSAYVRRKVKDEAAAADVLQDVFVKMYQNLPQLREEQRAEFWLWRIAHNAVMDHFRQQRSLQQPLPPTEESPTEAEAHTRALTEEVAQWLPMMLELLPPKYREALYLTEIEGLSQRELAERLQISYSGAKSRVQRGREKLRETVLQCCEVATDRYGNVLGYRQRERPAKEQKDGRSTTSTTNRKHR